MAGQDQRGLEEGCGEVAFRAAYRGLRRMMARTLSSGLMRLVRQDLQALDLGRVDEKIGCLLD